jgi:hypothetical protein
VLDLGVNLAEATVYGTMALGEIGPASPSLSRPTARPPCARRIHDRAAAQQIALGCQMLGNAREDPFVSSWRSNRWRKLRIVVSSTRGR